MLFATKIQSIEARRLFPCWDEPQYIAGFYISVNHHKNYKVLSSIRRTQIKEDLLKENWLWTEFDFRNQALSTRAVVIVVTDAASSPAQFTSDNIWSRFHSQSSYIRFGVEIIQTMSTLKIFMNMSIPFYALVPPEDITQKIVVPSIRRDITKWGLVIFKEELFTYDVEVDAVAHKMHVAHTIIRGLIHYWLGNRMTSFLWSYQWFNEALFSFFQIEILDSIFPDWQPRELFVVQIQQESLHLDTDFYIRPLSYVGRRPSEIQSLFSYPFYVKAPAILRMLQHIVSLKKFDEIVKHYLDQTIPNFDYLWNLTEIELDKSKLYYHTIKDIAEGWTIRSNYPIVEVLRVPNQSQVLIKPYRYHLNGDIGLHNVPTRLIPITFTIQKEINFTNTKPIQWLIPQYQEKITISINKTDWIIVNLQQTGYYRVKYDNENWELLANYLNSEAYTNIHIINRAQLIDDAYHFWVAHQLNYTVFKNLIEYLRQETNYIAWYPMLQAFRYISQFLPFQEIEPLIGDIRYILSTLHIKLNYTESSNDTDLIKCLRQETVRWACTFGDSKCQAFASALLQNYLKDPNEYKLLPGWKDWIYCTGSIKENRSILNTAWEDLSLEHLSSYEIFEYFPCAEIFFNDLAFDDILRYFQRTVSTNALNNTYIPYQFVARHATKYIDDITTNFWIYNSIILDINKLLSIIIYNSHSDYQINKIKQFIQDELIDNMKNDMQNILYIIKRRLYYIKNKKDKLRKLLHI